jgi:hypothetical protein
MLLFAFFVVSCGVSFWTFQTGSGIVYDAGLKLQQPSSRRSATFWSQNHMLYVFGGVGVDDEVIPFLVFFWLLRPFCTNKHPFCVNKERLRIIAS